MSSTSTPTDAASSAATPAPKMPGTPPAWVNAVVRTLLRTPGIRAVLGRSFAVITVTGAVTGERYSTPVQYVRDGDTLLVTSQRHRRWWRNIHRCPQVEMLVRGRRVPTMARIAEPTESVDLIERIVRLEPRVARLYGIATDAAGRPDHESLVALADRVVVIVVDA